ncbi:MAG: SAF domain-containing protein [Actinomycetota bacterium]|jgi:Flp pilus assembly protein CpaB|nr:SAF domain-containing protein [Actinomycetota bacterium]
MSSGGKRGGARTADVAQRRIRPRRVWPGSRALVGGLLVAIAGLGLFAAYQRSEAQPTTSYVVATVDIAPGTTVTLDMVGLQNFELPASVAAGAFGANADDELLGSVAVGPIAAGEILQRAALRPGGEGGDAPAPYEQSFELESSRALNGDLRAGEYVDVVATVGSGSAATTELNRDRLPDRSNPDLILPGMELRLR